MDEEWLGVADGAILTTFDVSSGLQQVASTALTEACSDAVVVSGHRFVCGPNSDINRVYRVYDLATGSLLNSSGGYTYKGFAMRRVPGADRFVTVTNNSPTDFNLFERQRVQSGRVPE